MPDMHDLLIGGDGALSENAKATVTIRNYVDQLAETSGTFRIREVEDVTPRGYPSEFFEWIGSWKLPQRFRESTGRGTRYVNPHYIHAREYTDVAVECRCGATFTRQYSTPEAAMRDTEQHADDCKSFWRLEVRAEMGRKRHDLIERLTLMGWDAEQLSKRLAVPKGQVSNYANRYGISMGDQRDEYRRLAGNTYAYLVREVGVDRHDLAAVYDCDPNTLYRWMREYGDYDGDAVYVRTGCGNYAWRPGGELEDGDSVVEA